MAKLGRQEHAIARHEPSRLSEPPMYSDEIRTSDAIAVKKNAILSSAGQDGTITHFRRPESSILLPHVHQVEREFALPTSH
jgi:hypothetical protein